MRKQTKLVAVLSAAALLAIGASMTSFAATGWTEENGTWVYYDKNGEMVTDTWAKSGDNWFYLDGAGEMAVDQLIEDGDNYYYVNENGAMASNKWVAIDNEDAGNDNEPQQWWYYFQANGKALKGPDDGKVSLKTINGKKYAFTSDGKMVYGWIKSGDATIINDDDDAWQVGDYYFGGENDGAMAVGWKLLDITDSNADTANQHWINPAFTDDEDQSRWFYFKTNGKKTVGTDKGDHVELKESTINGKKYGFDEYGRMVAEWSQDQKAAYAASGSSSYAQTNSQTWKYFSSIESGARVTKGWFKVVPSENLNSGDFDDDTEGWYYADNNGHIYAGELKTIKGKKYAFNAKGKMLSGTQFLQVTTGGTIVSKMDSDDATYNYDTEDGFDTNAGFLAGLGYRCYYFGDGDDGAMKTGTTSLTIDGDKFNFSFGKSGSSKGVGKIGADNKKLYNSGKLVTAGKDEKYQPVIDMSNGGTIGGDAYVGYIKLTDSSSLRSTVASNAGFVTGSTINAHYISYADLKDSTTFAATGLPGTLSDFKTKTGLSYNDKYGEIVIYTTTTGGTTTLGLPADFQVVNTSGKISEKQSKNKDGNDTYYKLYSGKIVATYIEN